MLTQDPIYKHSSIFCFKPILLSAHKLTLLIYGDNTGVGCFTLTGVMDLEAEEAAGVLQAPVKPAIKAK